MGRPPLWVQLPPQSYHDPRSTPPNNFSHWINFVLLWMAHDEVIWIEGPITLQTDMTVAAQGCLCSQGCQVCQNIKRVIHKLAKHYL
jgi:hypothetical protein